MSRTAHALHGLAAGGSALLAMGLVAATGVWLLGVPVSGGLVAAVVALGAGGGVELTLDPGGGRGVALQGTFDGLPLGVTFAGVLALVAVFALPLRHRKPGPADLAVRSGSALAACGVLTWLVAREGAGTIELAGRGTVHFHAGAVAAAAWASTGTVVVLALGWSAWRFEPVRRPMRAAGLVLLAACGLCLLGGLAAGLVQGRPQVAGGALLGAPNAALLAIPYGLGVPIAVDLPGQAGLPRLDDGGWLRPATTAVSIVVVLAIGLLAARPVRAGLAAGGALLACTLLTSVSGAAGFGMFDALTLEVRGNPWLALLFGLAGGAVAGGVGARLRDHGKPARSR